MMGDSNNRVLARNLEQLNVGGALRRQLETHEPAGVSLEISGAGNPQLIINGQPVYEPADAAANAAREINAFLDPQDPDLVVFFGFGLGLHAQLLRLKTKVPILVFEPGLDVLAKVLPNVPQETEGISLITNTGHLIEAAGAALSPTRMKLAVGAIPAYRQLYPAEFDIFRSALRQAIKKLEIDQNTKSFFAKDWISHPRDNLPTLIRSKPLHVLGDIFAGKPGILVGAGPSLDENIATLKQAKEHALICAVHTAVTPLAKAGITPDIAVIIESHQLDYFFREVSDIGRIFLAPDPQTHPRHLGLGFKDLLTITTSDHSAADWMQRAYDIPPLQSGGSVACSAFSLLHQLGCDPIILVGMDTAFTHGRTHSLNSDSGCCRVALDPETNSIAYTYLDGRLADGHWEAQVVEAWGGQGTVLTRPVYSSFRHWFESASQTWASDHTLINATEGGARFQGFGEMTLTDALGRFAQGEVPAFSLIEDAIAAGDLLDPRPLGEAIRSELDTVRAAAAMASKAEKSSAKALRMLRSRQLSTLQPVLDQLGRHEKNLQDLTRQTRLLNSLIGYRAMALSTKKPAYGDKIRLTINSVEKSREISRLVRDAADELEEIYAPLAASFLAQDQSSG